MNNYYKICIMQFEILADNRCLPIKPERKKIMTKYPCVLSCNNTLPEFGDSVLTQRRTRSATILY